MRTAEPPRRGSCARDPEDAIARGHITLDQLMDENYRKILKRTSSRILIQPMAGSLIEGRREQDRSCCRPAGARWGGNFV